MRLDWLILPFTSLVYLQNSGIWNIIKIGWGKDNLNHQILDDGSLKVYYPAGSYSPSKFPQGGIGFYASPQDIFPCEKIILSYEVKFDKTFNPVFGGKLPGLFLSESTNIEDMQEASGGKHNNNTASIRIVWRKSFDGEAYVYIPKNQSEDYKNLQNYVENEKYGDSLWRGLFKFNQNEWNKVMIKLKVNSFDKNKNPVNNGILEVNINGIKYRFNKLIWRNNPQTKITAILFSTFFGGSSIKYATPIDTWSYFRNFRVKNL